MFVEFTQKDIDRAKIVKPDWYRIRITGISSKISKAGDSTNLFLEGMIIKSADKGDETFAGVPTPGGWMVNSKAIGQFVPILQAIEPSFVAEPGKRVDVEAIAGQELEAFIGNGNYNNQIQNQMTGQYRPVVEKRTV